MDHWSTLERATCVNIAEGVNEQLVQMNVGFHRNRPLRCRLALNQPVNVDNCEIRVSSVSHAVGN